MQLMSQNLRLRKHGRGLYDSVEISRLDAIIGNSSGPEEALSKRCSLFTLADISNTNTGNTPRNRTESVSGDEKDNSVIEEKLSIGSIGDKSTDVPNKGLEKDNPLIVIRRRQLRSLGFDIQSRLKQAIWLRSKASGSSIHFDSLLESIEGHQLGDSLVATKIQKLVHRAESSANPDDGIEFYLSPQEVSAFVTKYCVYPN